MLDIVSCCIVRSNHVKGDFFIIWGLLSWRILYWSLLYRRLLWWRLLRCRETTLTPVKHPISSQTIEYRYKFKSNPKKSSKNACMAPPKVCAKFGVCSKSLSKTSNFKSNHLVQVQAECPFMIIKWEWAPKNVINLRISPL